MENIVERFKAIEKPEKVKQIRLGKYSKLMKEGYKPSFIIGVPVGFVNVEASKELILNSEVPFIVNKGRKGGSNVAAAICNAILYQVREEILNEKKLK